MRYARLIRARLFATPIDAIITLVIAYLLWRALVPIIDWMLIHATFTGTTRS